MAEELLCRRLGIVGEDEAATQDAIDRYVKLYNGRLPQIAVAALRASHRWKMHSWSMVVKVR
jgi:hypothetical protein